MPLLPRHPSPADGLLPLQRFLDRPDLLAVLLAAGMDPRAVPQPPQGAGGAGAGQGGPLGLGLGPGLGLSAVHSYALLGRYQQAAEVPVAGEQGGGGRWGG